MDGYIQVKSKVSGLTGKLPANKFDPSKYEAIGNTVAGVGSSTTPTNYGSGSSGEYTGQGPKLNWGQKAVTNKAIPLYAGGIAGGIAGLPFGAVGSIPGAAIGAGSAYALQDLLKPFFGVKQPERETALKESGKTALTASANQAFGEVLGWLGSKILGTVLPKIKIGTPSTVQKSISKVSGETGKNIENIVKAKGSTPINTTQLVDEVNLLKQRPEVLRTPEAIPGIEGVSSELQTVKDLLGAYGSKVKFGQQTFGEAGKELTKRGTKGITEKSAYKIGGGGLEKLITKEVPELGQLFKEYSQLSKLGSSMQYPFKNYYQGLVTTALLSMAGIPGSKAIGTAATLNAMPYTNIMSKKIIGSLLKDVSPKVIKTIAPLLEQYLISNEQPQLLNQQ